MILDEVDIVGEGFVGTEAVVAYRGESKLPCFDKAGTFLDMGMSSRIFIKGPVLSASGSFSSLRNLSRRLRRCRAVPC